MKAKLSEQLEGFHRQLGGTEKTDIKLKKAILDDITSDEIPFGKQLYTWINDRKYT